MPERERPPYIRPSQPYEHLVSGPARPARPLRLRVVAGALVALAVFAAAASCVAVAVVTGPAPAAGVVTPSPYGPPR